MGCIGKCAINENNHMCCLECLSHLSKKRENDNMAELKQCPFCGCRDRRVGIRRMGSNGYRVCCSRCGSLGPHVSVKEWNGQKEIAQKKAIEKRNERL